MKLVFRKNDEEQISVYQSIDGEERPFSYSKMINTLIRSRRLEAPETYGDFTQEEKNSINSMIDEINKVMRDDQGSDDRDESGVGG